MNNIEDDVGFDSSFFVKYSWGLSNKNPLKNEITKLSFGKSIVDRLEYEYDTTKLHYFQIVGDSQTFTYKNNIFTTQNQKQYLWKNSENTNIYNKTFLHVDEISNNNRSMMIGTLEMNFVPEFKSPDFDVIKILLPVFKTNRINKNGVELLNCIRMANDIAIPTKNIDMSDFIPKNVPYFIKDIHVKSEGQEEYDIKVGAFIFSSSNIHLDENTIQPHYFNILNKFIDMGYYTRKDILEKENFWIEDGIKFKSQEKNCREVHYEGETFTHSTNKNNSISIENMPIEERIGQIIQSPLGLQIVIIVVFLIILIIYKIILNTILKRIGETSETWYMSKAGEHYSSGAFLIFIIIFISFAHMMSDDFWADEW